MGKPQRSISAEKLVIAFIAVFLFALAWLMWHNNQEAEPITFNLAPLSEGVYAYRETVVSSIPAENYDMCTVCQEGGIVFTVKGNIKVVFNDEVQPYVVYVDHNTVNCDRLTVYVPSGSVEFLGVQKVSGGRRR